MTIYSQGVAEDGPVLLKDGLPLTIEEVIVELNNPTIRIQYAGAVQLLCEASTRVDEDTREKIQFAVEDWCMLTGWSWLQVSDSILLVRP